jgi:hypothetical protein
MVQVRPDVMPEQVRPRLPHELVLEQIDRSATEILVSLDHREPLATGQNRGVNPTWTMQLGDIARIAQVVVDRSRSLF